MDTQSLLYLIAFAGGVYAVVNRKRVRAAFVWLGIYLIASGLLQFIGMVMIKHYGINTTGMYNVVIFVYHFILFMFFISLPSERNHNGKITLLFILGALLILYFILSNEVKSWFSYKAIILSNLIYTAAALFYILDLLRSTVAENPLRSGRFIALFGILFYFATSAVYFAMIQVFLGRITPGLLRWVNIVLLFFFYIIQIVAIHLEIKQHKRRGIS